MSPKSFKNQKCQPIQNSIEKQQQKSYQMMSTLTMVLVVDIRLVLVAMHNLPTEPHALAI